MYIYYNFYNFFLMKYQEQKLQKKFYKIDDYNKKFNANYKLQKYIFNKI